MGNGYDDIEFYVTSPALLCFMTPPGAAHYPFTLRVTVNLGLRPTTTVSPINRSKAAR